MPLPSKHEHILIHFVFGHINGIDPLARAGCLDLLAYLGYDNTSIVYDMLTTQIDPVKLRAACTTPAGIALLAIVDNIPGQLATICNFLLKLQNGTIDRFLVNHSSTEVLHLQMLTTGSHQVHGWVQTWTAYTIDESIVTKLKLTDASSFRAFITYVRTSLPAIAYLLGELPVDNCSLIGKQKDEFLYLLLSKLLTASNLGNTFKLSTVVGQTGYDLFGTAKTHFLTTVDVMSEIQQLETKLINTKITTQPTIPAFIEEIQGIIIQLRELGKVVTDLEIYTRLRTEISNANSRIGSFCISFKQVHRNPDDSTLQTFITDITTDPDAMAYNNPNFKGARGAEANQVKTNDLKENEKRDKRFLKNENKKEQKAALKHLATKIHSLKTQNNSNSTTTNEKFKGLPDTVINFIKKVRKEWDDETYGTHSDITKVFNEHVDSNGKHNYKAFMVQLNNEHLEAKSRETMKSSSKPNIQYLMDAAAEESQMMSVETVTETVTEAPLRRF